MEEKEKAVNLHKKYKGKIEIKTKIELDAKSLPLLYTPHVADVCLAIKEDEELFYETCLGGHLACIFSNGTRTLGLGNIGPRPCYPVMEGKAYLLKALANVDAIPLVVNERDKEMLKAMIKAIEPSFAVINLEDIEKDVVIPLYDELKKEMAIFHDDRHGTGIVVLAGVINTLKLLNLDRNANIVVVGAGSAGLGIVEMLNYYGFKNIAVVDSKGQINEERELNDYKKILLNLINPRGKTTEDAFEDADILIAASKPGSVSEEWIEKMKKDRALFLLSNPIPEIPYEKAIRMAKIVATGRSDYPNQINNILAMPGIFKGVIMKKRKRITEEMMIKAAEIIAGRVKPSYSKIVPSALDKDVPNAIALKI
jgi:malate dehydrogenase (oxaloacetate-decarboxylating)